MTAKPATRTALALPQELTTALNANSAARNAWNALPPSHQREHVRYVIQAKKPETRQTRAAKTIEALTRS